MRVRIITASFVTTFAIALRLAEAQPSSPGGVTVYHRVADLQLKDGGKGPALTIPLRISGSSSLKVAFIARATGGIDQAPLNMFDALAKDNTTALSYAWVDDSWRSVLYRCDRFRYNGGRVRDIVKPEAEFENVRFFGAPTPGQQGVLHIKNLVVYRGEDTEAPAAPGQPSASQVEGGVKLSWAEPKDNVGVARYVISRASASGRYEKLAETSDVTFTDKSGPVGAVQYRVLAVDFQDNMSLWSQPVPAANSGAAPAVVPTRYEEDRRAYASVIRRIHDAGVGRVVRGRVLQFGDSLSDATLYRLEAEAAFGRYAVEARGRQGWRTNQGRGVIEQDLRELRPEFCLILYGTNNTKDGSTNRLAMSDLRFMTEACATAGAVPVIATIPPRGFLDPSSRPEAEFNTELVKTFRTARVPIAYLFEQLQTIPDRHAFLAPDGIHWARPAFKLTAGIWRDVMTQVQFALLDRPD